VAEPVRTRRLSEDEGRRLTQIVRRGRGNPIGVRRATIMLASTSGTPVPTIARLVAADEDTVRDVIHAFNERGLAALDPRWAGGRPRLISDDDVTFIVTTATTRLRTLGRPFTRWSLRKLAAYLARNSTPRVVIGRERLRLILRAQRCRSSGPAPGRSRTTRTRTPSSTGSRRSPTGSRTDASPSTSSGRCRSAPATAAPGHRRPSRRGCRRPTGAPTVSATSTAATAWATTSCGVWYGAVRAATAPSPR
jgi:transposase